MLVISLLKIIVLLSHLQPHFEHRLYNYYTCGLDRQTKPGTCLNKSCEIAHLLCFHFWVKSEVQLPLVLPSLRFISAREKLLMSVYQAAAKAL